jgi:hypothetical protein
MLRLVIIYTIIFFISCGQSESEKKDSIASIPKETFYQKDNKVENALKFINDYVTNSNKIDNRTEIIEWVNSNNLTTKSFKSELKKIIDDAYKTEPEVGLNFDPILDAQENPEKGFELEVFDEKTNYLIIRGKDWQEFKLTMKVAEENGNWLVDGCGIVNIPDSKKSKR